MADPSIDYVALAKQYGGTMAPPPPPAASAPQSAPIDYLALAKQYGGSPAAAAPTAPRDASKPPVPPSPTASGLPFPAALALPTMSWLQKFKPNPSAPPAPGDRGDLSDIPVPVPKTGPAATYNPTDQEKADLPPAPKPPGGIFGQMDAQDRQLNAARPAMGPSAALPPLIPEKDRAPRPLSAAESEFNRQPGVGDRSEFVTREKPQPATFAQQQAQQQGAAEPIQNGPQLVPAAPVRLAQPAGPAPMNLKPLPTQIGAQLTGEFKAGTPAGEAERRAYTSPLSWQEQAAEGEQEKQQRLANMDAFENKVLPRLLPNSQQQANQLSPAERQIFEQTKAQVAAGKPLAAIEHPSIWMKGQEEDAVRKMHVDHPMAAQVEDAIQDKLSDFSRADQLAILAALPESKLVSLYFGSQMALGAKHEFEEGSKAAAEGDPKKALYSRVGAVIDGIAATLALGHGAAHAAHIPEPLRAAADTWSQRILEETGHLPTNEMVRSYIEKQAETRAKDKAAPGGEPRTVEPGSDEEKPILHDPNATVEELRASAERHAGPLGDALAAATENVDGAKLEAVRDSKDTGRIEGKAERQGVQPAQIGDISAAKVTVPDQAAADKVLENLHEQLPVEKTEGAVSGEPGKNAVRQVQATVDLGKPDEPVKKAEVLIQTPEMAEATAKTHDDYRKAQELRAAGDEAGAKAIEDKIAAVHEAAEQSVRTRIQNGEEGGRGQSPEQTAGASTAPQPKFEYGNTQAPIDPKSDAGLALESARNKIDKADLGATGYGGNASGLETEPHVTLRYGLKSTGDIDKLRKFIESQAPFDARLGPTDSFPPSKSSDGLAPIIAPVDAPELHRMEAEIDKHGEFTDRTFPEYKPHATLGYVKPEAAGKYTGDKTTDGKTFRVDSIAVSDRDGKVTEIPLKGAAEPERQGRPVLSDSPEQTQLGNKPQDKVERVPVDQIQLDPKRFQYKMDTDQSGVTNLLKGRKWNEDLAGRINVWRDPEDNKLYVVNGHHRFQLARENGVPDVKVDYINAGTPEEARAIGALQNIAEGRGSAMDAAKFFRDSGYTPDRLDDLGISMGEATAANGLALSRLDPSLFDQVVSGKLRQGRAIAIGNASADAADQEALLKLIQRSESKGRKVTDDVVDELARMVKGSDRHTETQTNLFGAQEMTRNLALEKADISSSIRDKIGQERRTFQSVADAGKAATLAKKVEGQTIKASENAKIAQDAQQAQELYDRLSTKAGTIDDILNRSAKQLAEGGNANGIKQRAYDDIRAELSKALGDSTGVDDRGVQAAAQKARPADAAPIPRARAAEPAAERGSTGTAGSADLKAPRPAEKSTFTEGRQSTPVLVRDADGNWVNGTLDYHNGGVNGQPRRGRVTLANGFKMNNVADADLRPATDDQVAAKKGEGQHWTGVDIDGTLAEYDGFKGPTVIGKPIQAMVDRVKGMLADGKDVRIFTARIGDDPTGEARAAIDKWVEKNIGQKLPITNVKDSHMEQLYDDRAVAVGRNTGEIIGGENAQNPVDREGKAPNPLEHGSTRPSGSRVGTEASRPPVPRTVRSGSTGGTDAAGGLRGAKAEPGDDAGRGTQTAPTTDRMDGVAGTIEDLRSADKSQPHTLDQERAANQTRAESRKAQLKPAADRSLRENAASHQSKIEEINGRKALVLDPDGEGVWHRVFKQIKSVGGKNPLGAGENWRGVRLDRTGVNIAVAYLKGAIEDLHAQGTPDAKAEAGFDKLTQLLKDARDQKGGAVILRGDYRADTAREEATHQWWTEHDLDRSEAMLDVASHPDFQATADKLRKMGYEDATPKTVAAEIIGKAMAGDPDLDMTDEEREHTVRSFLTAAVEDKGPRVLDDLPAADPRLKDVIDEVRRSYGEQSESGAQRGAGQAIRDEGKPAGDESRAGPGGARPRDQERSRQPGSNRIQPGDEEKPAAQGELTRPEKSSLLTSLFQSVFHGTPHKFDKFTLDHIGSGEGAQAYGHGLYFAGDKAVADYYRKALGVGVYLDDKPADSRGMPFADSAMTNMFSNRKTAGLTDKVAREQTAAWAKNNKQIQGDYTPEDIDKFVSRLTQGQGHLYEADIPEDEKMLDWDKPFSKQSDHVKDALDRLFAQLHEEGNDSAALDLHRLMEDDATGASIYDTLSKNFGADREFTGGWRARTNNDIAASDRLNEVGISGNKYLDAGSRGKGEGTHNYVVFDDNAIKILKRYGDEAPLFQRVKGKLPESLALPGMARDIEANKESAAEEQGKALTDRLREPGKNVAAATGRMEQHSPLFAGTDANPQGSLFQKGRDGENPVARSVKDLVDEMRNAPKAAKGTMLDRVSSWTKDTIDESIGRSGSALEKIPDQFQRAWAWSKATTAALVHDYLHPLEQTDWKKSAGQMQLAQAETALRLQDLAKELKAAAPKPIDRIAMTHYMEAAGDQRKLREWATGAKANAMKSMNNPLLSQERKSYLRDAVDHYEAATKLSPEQKALAGQLRQHFDDMLDIAKENGLLGYGYRNYVMHLYEKADAANLLNMVDTNDLQPNPNFIKKRFFDTFYSAEQAGMKPKSKDIGYLLTAYDKSMNQAIASRNFMRSLLDAKAPDGRPIAAIKMRGGWVIAKEGEAPQVLRQRARPASLEGYRDFDRPQLRNFLFKPTTEDLAGFDPKLFDEDPDKLAFKGDLMIHPKYAGQVEDLLTPGWFERGDTWPQKLGKGLQTLSGVAKESMTAAAPFHMVQLGVHGMEHLVNPFKVPELDLSGKSPESQTQRLLASHGLALVNYDAEGLFGTKAMHGVAEHVPFVNKAMDAVQAFSHWQFQDYIPRLKMKMAVDAFERNTKLYGKKLSEDQIAELTAKESNAAFGNLNTMFDAVPRTKTFKSLLKLATFAPDFLESRMRFIGQALTPYGGEQRAALVRGALAMYIAARIGNALVNNGDAKWDPEHALSLVVNGKAYAMRTVQGDLLHAIDDPRGFIYNRLNPLTTRPMVQFLSGRDQFGQQLTAGQQVKSLSKSVLPFGMQKVIQTPDESVMNSILTSAGVNARNDRTPIEDEVHKMYLANLPSSPLDEEKDAERRELRQHEDAMREGKEGPGEVWRLVDKGEVSPAQAARTIARSNESRLSIEFKALHLEQAADVYGQLLKEAKHPTVYPHVALALNELRPEMQYKRTHDIADLPEADRDKWADKLDAMLDQDPLQ